MANGAPKGTYKHPSGYGCAHVRCWITWKISTSIWPWLLSHTDEPISRRRRLDTYSSPGTAVHRNITVSQSVSSRHFHHRHHRVSRGRDCRGRLLAESETVVVEAVSFRVCSEWNSIIRSEKRCVQYWNTEYSLVGANWYRNSAEWIGGKWRNIVGGPVSRFFTPIAKAVKSLALQQFQGDLRHS